jgi:hypothetical protein
MASIVQQISLQTDAETVSATSYTAIANIVHRYWDADLYDGTVQIYFEATIDPSGSGRTIYAALYDGAGNQVANSEISQYGGDYNGPILVRSAALTLTDNTEYHVRAYRAVGNGILAGCRLVIKQSGTITKTATYIDFMGDIDSTSAGTYGYTSYGCGWTYDADMYDGITAAYFEAEVRHSTGAYTMGCELYNKTDSSQVGEVGTNSTSFNRQRTADIKANLVDGKVLGVRHKDGGGGYGYTTMGSLIIVQQNFTKSCSLLSTPQYLTTTTSVHIPIMIRFTKADWSCKTTPTAKVFACCVIGNLGTNPSHWAAIRRHDQTTNIGVVSAITASAPYIQVVSADVYSILQTDDEYRGIASAYNDEGGATTLCYHFGLQVEYTLPVNRTLAASGSSYSVTGTAASLKKSSNISAGVGSYSVSGTTATLTYTRTGPTLNAGIGSYIMTGTAAGLSISRMMVAGADSYRISGASAGLYSSRITGAGSGSYTIPGTAATLSFIGLARTLTAASGLFFVVGPVGGKTLKKSLSLVSVSPGLFAITGMVSGLLYSHVTLASSGSYTVTEIAATFLYNRVFTASPGPFIITGSAVDFLNGTNLPAALGSFAVNGASTGLCRTHIFAVSDGTIAITGTAATLEETRGITASPGELTAPGTGAALLKHSVLVADPDKSTTVITRYIADSWEGEFAQASLTTTYNPADLPDDIVIVCFGLDSRAEIASVTLRGRNFTKLAAVEGTGSGYHRGELWYLVGPPHEDSEFSITLNDPQGQWTLFRVDHYYNVDQYDPFGDVAATFAAGKYGISGTVEDVQEGQFPFDWIVNTVSWYTLTPGEDQTILGISNFGHFARGMSHRYGDTGDLGFSWSVTGIAGDNVHIATVLKQPAFRNVFSIDGCAVNLLKVVEMTIHDATHGITLSGTVLIVAGTYELVIDDSVHAVTMGTIALTMPDTLTIDDAAHTITVQKIALVMPGLLTINNAVHQVTLPDISLGGIEYEDLDAVINIGEDWKDIIAIRVQIGGAWRDVTGITLRQ